jgi:CRP-like cAMP-binding protein
MELRASVPLGDDSGSLFLEAMPPAAYAELKPYLKLLTLKQRYSVHEPNVTIETVLFPIDAVVSIVTQMSDGATVEVSLVGREGMTGLPVLLASGKSAQRAFAQIAGTAWCADAQIVRELFDENEVFRTQVLHYAYATLTAVSQFAACNRLHQANERCARWLLMAHDRVPGDEIRLTQEFLSEMIGVRRPGVTVIALALQEAGLIRYTRGKITVLDRGRLQARSCECYRVVEDEWERVVGYRVRRRRR